MKIPVILLILISDSTLLTKLEKSGWERKNVSWILFRHWLRHSLRQGETLTWSWLTPTELYTVDWRYIQGKKNYWASSSGITQNVGPLGMRKVVHYITSQRTTLIFAAKPGRWQSEPLPTSYYHSVIVLRAKPAFLDVGFVWAIGCTLGDADFSNIEVAYQKHTLLPRSWYNQTQ